MRTYLTTLIIIILQVCANLNASHKVYLIHGYCGIGTEMAYIESELKLANFETRIFKYHSLTKDIKAVANELAISIRGENVDTIYFITHSMGALVVRALYEQIDNYNKLPIIKRMVTIAPPNNGSPVADYLMQFQIVRDLAGPNINYLTTKKFDNNKQNLAFANCEIGLIAGSFGNERGVNIFIKRDNDGVLIPTQTLTGREKDVLFVKQSHVGILFNKEVAIQCIHFLKKGNFK